MMLIFKSTVTESVKLSEGPLFPFLFDKKEDFTYEEDSNSSLSTLKNIQSS